MIPINIDALPSDPNFICLYLEERARKYFAGLAINIYKKHTLDSEVLIKGLKAKKDSKSLDDFEKQQQKLTKDLDYLRSRKINYYQSNSLLKVF